VEYQEHLRTDEGAARPALLWQVPCLRAAAGLLHVKHYRGNARLLEAREKHQNQREAAGKRAQR